MAGTTHGSHTQKQRHHRSPRSLHQSLAGPCGREILCAFFRYRQSPRTHLKTSMRGACAALVLLASAVLGTHGSRSTATARQPPSFRLSRLEARSEDDGHLSSLGQERRFPMIERRLAIAPQVTIEAYRVLT